jgi:hypothetical protein
MISRIIDLNILNQPEEGIVGLKWQETRLKRNWKQYLINYVIHWGSPDIDSHDCVG